MIGLVMAQGGVGVLAAEPQPRPQRRREVVDRHPQHLRPHPQGMGALLVACLLDQRGEEGE